MEKKSRRNNGNSKNQLDGRLMQNYIIDELKKLFKEPKCELNYNNDWQLLIAILLSAQCSDKKVNEITPTLFTKYASLSELKKASYNDLELTLRPLGLSKVKAKNIIELSRILNEKHANQVPNKKEELVKLPGIGNKSANVMLVEYFKIPAFPVDTHVARVSKRLNLCKENDDVMEIENKLMKYFDKNEWGTLHLRLVLF